MKSSMSKTNLLPAVLVLADGDFGFLFLTPPTQ